MAVVHSDNLIDTQDLPLLSHAADVAGGGYTKHPNWSGTYLIRDNHARQSNSGAAVYLANAQPFSRNMYCQGLIRMVGSPASGSMGFMTRLNGASNSWYWGRFKNAALEIYLDTGTLLATKAFALASSATTTLTFRSRGHTHQLISSNAVELSVVDPNNVNDSGYGGIASNDITTTTAGVFLDNFIVGNYSEFQNAWANVIFDGDSLTAPTMSGLTRLEQGWPSLTSLAYPSHVYWNAAVSGRATAATLSGISTPLSYIDPTAHTNIYCLMIGVNDAYNGTPAATAYANIVSICDQMRAAGCVVIVNTVAPYNTTGGSGSGEAIRLALNALILANWRSFAHVLIDITANSTMGDAGDNTNTTYYHTDGTHWNATGHAYYAVNLFYPAFDTALLMAGLYPIGRRAFGRAMGRGMR